MKSKIVIVKIKNVGVVDIRTGVTDTDTFIARILQKTKKNKNE